MKVARCICRHHGANRLCLTWRTIMKESRQSCSALWWSLWNTSGCSSSRMASTLRKKARWFCCRNSWKLRWMRPCNSPATMGRCLETSTDRELPARHKLSSKPLLHQYHTHRKTESNSSFVITWTVSWTILTLGGGLGGTQPASYKLG